MDKPQFYNVDECFKWCRVKTFENYTGIKKQERNKKYWRKKQDKKQEKSKEIIDN